MAWTETAKKNVGTLWSATDFSALKGNIEYLHQPNYVEYNSSGVEGDWTITHPGTYTGVYAGSVGAAWELSLTTNGGLVIAGFSGRFICSSASGSLRIAIVHTAINGADITAKVNMIYNYQHETSYTGGQHAGWMQFFPSIPAGTHTFKLYWGVYAPASAIVGTLKDDERPRMWVMEL